MALAAMVAVMGRLIGCLLGELAFVLGIGGRRGVRMIEFEVSDAAVMKLVDVRHGDYRLHGN